MSERYACHESTDSGMVHSEKHTMDCQHGPTLNKRELAAIQFACEYVLAGIASGVLSTDAETGSDPELFKSIAEYADWRFEYAPDKSSLSD